MPQPNPLSEWWHYASHAAVKPPGRLISPAHYYKWATGGRKALDVNDFGEVPDSSWFHNRIGRWTARLSEQELSPLKNPGPASGTLTVINGKPAGVTPGFIVKDSAEVVWFVKFDQPAYPELTTGAEIISSKLLYAAGYHVPEMHIVHVDLQRFQLAPNARGRGRYNESVALHDKDLQSLLAQLNPNPDGKARALFSRALPGKYLGPFAFEGTRLDDPNDLIPHQRRRSLRGLWLFSAWLNNIEPGSKNTIDSFIPVKDGQGFVKHYLLDFGSALGATGVDSKHLSDGYENLVSWSEIAQRWASLGLRYPYWLAVKRSRYRGVGIFESTVFDPERWAPLLPNPSFQEATPRDTFWAASILARFTPKQIAAAVASAEYSEPGAEQFVTEVLIQRQKKLLRFALEDMAGIVDPIVKDDTWLYFSDLKSRAKTPLDYSWTISWNRTSGQDRVLESSRGAETRVDLRPAIGRLIGTDPREFQQDPYLTLTLRRIGASAGVHVHIRVVHGSALIVGVERDLD
jgi:hypothetical protein